MLGLGPLLTPYCLLCPTLVQLNPIPSWPRMSKNCPRTAENKITKEHTWFLTISRSDYLRTYSNLGHDVPYFPILVTPRKLPEFITITNNWSLWCIQVQPFFTLFNTFNKQSLTTDLCDAFRLNQLTLRTIHPKWSIALREAGNWNMCVRIEYNIV